jgi:hypothetical protein
MQTRAEVRERYGIRRDAIGDCLALWCCRPCSLTQERREIELEQFLKSKSGWSGGEFVDWTGHWTQ